MNNLPGLFVSFEGPDGSGKTTQLVYTAEWLLNAGLDPVVVRDPGTTPIGKTCREVLLHGPRDIPVAEEVELFKIARISLVEGVIRPALREGRIVLADRFHDSTIAYQTFGNDNPKLRVDYYRWHHRKIGIEPDLTILMKVAIDTLLGRIGNDRMESKGRVFLEKVVRGYDSLEECTERIKGISGDSPIPVTVRRIRETLLPVIDNWLDHKPLAYQDCKVRELREKLISSVSELQVPPPLEVLIDSTTAPYMKRYFLEENETLLRA